MKGNSMIVFSLTIRSEQSVKGSPLIVREHVLQLVESLLSS